MKKILALLLLVAACDTGTAEDPILVDAGADTLAAAGDALIAAGSSPVGTGGAGGALASGGAPGAGGTPGGAGGGGGVGGMVAGGAPGAGGAPAPTPVPMCDINVKVGGFSVDYCSRDYPPGQFIFQTFTDVVAKRKLLCATCRANKVGDTSPIKGCYLNLPETNNLVYCTTANACGGECNWDPYCTYRYSDPWRPVGASEMPTCRVSQ